MSSKNKLEITMNADVLEAFYSGAKDFRAFKKWLQNVMVPAISKQKPITEKYYIRCLKQEAKFSLS